MKTIHVALAQINFGNDISENYIKAEKCLIKAKELWADVVLFPEMLTIGYEDYPNNEADQKVWKEKSFWVDSPEYKKYIELSRKVGIAMVFTFLESDKERTQFYNTASLIDSKGHTVFTYRKTHLVDKAWERMLTAGNDFPVGNLEIHGETVKIGIMICYDREFPEVARILMLNGAEIVLVPNACTIESNRIAQFQTRGFENMMGVAMTNYPRLGGKSMAFDGMRKKWEDYDPCIIMADDSEGVFMASFDIQALRNYRENEIWGDTYRRPQLYSPLIENNPQTPFKRENARR